MKTEVCAPRGGAWRYSAVHHTSSIPPSPTHLLYIFAPFPRSILLLLPLPLQLFSKGEDQTLLDAMREYAEMVKPELVIIASKGLCECLGGGGCTSRVCGGGGQGRVALYAEMV